MRPNQNKRMRGRPGNNRRGPNPLTRSYESNGPDVKIRGNAHHVAEKYLQLARDAHTSGDPVAAENYLQHAEHYYRLIAAAQAAQLAAQNGGRDADFDDDDDDDGGVLADQFASPSERNGQMNYNGQPPQPGFQPQPGYQPQPVYQPQPQFQPQPTVAGGQQGYAGNDRQPFEGGQDRPQGERQDRPAQGERQNFQPRQDRQHGRGPMRDRNFGDRPDGQREQRRDFRPYRDPNGAQPRAELPPAQPQPDLLPPFITGGGRPTPAPAPYEAPLEAPQPPLENQTVEPVAEAQPAAAGEAEGDARFPRGRRRRLRSPYGFLANGHPDEGQPPAAAEEETPASE